MLDFHICTCASEVGESQIFEERENDFVMFCE